jgi:hypothetical protein
MEDLMEKIKNFVFLFLIIFVFSSINIYAEAEQKKTDFKIGAKIIGVADPDYKEYSYIDMGSAHGVKPGDRFMVEGKYGKVMVEVVQAFQRMSSVKIVDSWLLNEGNTGEMIPASRYPKIRIAKYVEKAKNETVLASKKLTPKKAKPKVTAKVEKPKKQPKKEEILPEEVSAEAITKETSTKEASTEDIDALISGETKESPVTTEIMPEEQGQMEIPEMESTGPESLTEIPGEEKSVGEIETSLPGEEPLPAGTGTEPGLPADTGMEPGLPADTGMEPGLPADTGTEPALPSDDLGVMPGDALPPMP